MFIKNNCFCMFLLVFVFLGLNSYANAGTITGKVTDSQGEPIRGICFDASIWDGSNLQLISYGDGYTSNHTDADGNYSFTSLPSGAYYIGFNNIIHCSDDYISKGYPNEEPYAPQSIANKTAVNVVAGQTTTGINVSLGIAGKISGKIVDAQGIPISGIQVGANTWNGSYLSNLSADLTDAEGNYTIGSLPSGAYYVSFIDYNGDNYISKGYPTEELYNRYSIANKTAVNVVAGQTTTGINASLVLGGKITGTVTDSQGTPLSGISVSILIWDGFFFWVIPLSDHSDAAGNYSIGSIPTGTYYVRFFHPNGIDSTVYPNEYPVDWSSIANKTAIAVLAGQSTLNINASLHLSAFCPDLPYTDVTVRESGDPTAIFTFEVTLAETLPLGYGVFLNFDDQQGNWFVENTPGGHLELLPQGGNVYSANYTLEKMGLRSFRAGIFDLNNDTDPANDVLACSYSENSTCTLPACLDTVSRPNSHGNPAITGSGSELFKNVDVAMGSYHLANVDMSVSGKGPSFAFSRAYNSLHKSPWTFAYEMKAQFRGDFQREIAIGPREDGHMQYFFKDMADPGQWHALNPGDFDKLVENEGDASFSLYTQGNRIYNFPDPAGVKAGRLETIKDRLNNALTFTYDGSNNLTGVTDANNRAYIIDRDPSNRISRVTDFSGRYVEYGYSDDGHNMITNVRKMRGDNFYDRYTYHSTSPTFLQSISDARVYPATQLDIIYTPDPITNDLYRVHTLTNTDGETEFTYGNSAQWGVYTGVSQPQVDTINHNRVYIRDAGRVIKMYDAKSASDALTSEDIVTTKTYKTAADNTHFTDLGLVTETNDPKSNNTIIAYNDTIGGGKPSQITDALFQETQANYNSTEVGINLRPVISVVQKEAGVGQTDLTTQYQDFTSTGQARVITDAEGYPTNRTFDAGNGLITQSTDSRNNVMQYDYDVYGNITKTTQLASPENIVTTRTYYNESDSTQLGLLKTEISPLGLITTYTYDEHGNILSRNESKASDDINYTTYYEYDASDNLIKTTDPKNNVTEYSYDNLNRKTQESYTVKINGILEILTKKYSYDALGRLATITNERGQSSQTHYTSRNQVERKVNPLDETTVTYTYDKNGNVETVKDGEGRVVTTNYDELNRKTRVTDNLGNYQDWVYNTAGQVASYQDGRGNITYYEYDKVGNLIRLIDPKDGITESTYDGNGNVLTVKDPNLNTTTYVYDELDRRISTTLNNNGQQWIYTYDSNGNVLSETTPTDEKTEKTYDALNRVTQLTEKAFDTTIVRQISYTYDDNSNVLTESSGSNMISYTYDEINRVKSVTDQYGQTIGYGYDEVGNQSALTYPGDKSIDYFYDDADRLESLTDWLSNTTSYTRNAAGQPLQVTYGNGTKVKYAYDSAGRLNLLQNLKADDSVISSHSMTLLDGAGNIKEVNVTLPLEPVLPESIILLTYDDKNRIETAGTKSYNHDETGRIIEEDKDGTQTIYNFDIKDHITSITQGGSTLSSYNYDLNNNRISQIQNGVETRYVIDPLASLPNVVAEMDNQGTVLHYYLYGEGLVSQIDGNGASHYYHYDPTGHTLALSDDSGDVTDKYGYAPYGFTTVQGTTHNPFRFVGRHGVMDDGNGLHYMRARFYKEDIKRFMSLDALHGEMATPQSLNRYAYVLGNPVLGIDPSGLKKNLLKLKMGWVELGKAFDKDLYYQNQVYGLMVQPKTEQEAIDRGCELMDPGLSIFHMRFYKWKNKKYVCADGSESVFMEDGSLDNSPENRGTYNLNAPSDKRGHTMYDVLPYYLYGTGEDDGVSVADTADRILNPLLDYYILKKMHEYAQ